MYSRFSRSSIVAGLFSVLLLCAGSSNASDPEADYATGAESWKNGDVVGAFPPLKKAAEAGHPAGQALYGYLLDVSGYDVEAADFYRRASEQGNPDGKFGLAGLYTSGHGGLTKDREKALSLLREASGTGHLPSTMSLVRHYTASDLSEEEKYSAEAFKWVQKGADLNDILALTRLEEAYRLGRFGLTLDLAKADEVQRKISKLQGIDPDAKKKRRSRL